VTTLLLTELQAAEHQHQQRDLESTNSSNSVGRSIGAAVQHTQLCHPGQVSMHASASSAQPALTLLMLFEDLIGGRVNAHQHA